MQVWNVLHAARTTLSGYIFTTKAWIDNQKKNLSNSNTSSTCPDNMVNFSLLTAEICWRVWGTHANFNGFRVLAALLHGTLVVGISQTLRHWTEGATYIRQGGHHVGHWPTFLVKIILTKERQFLKILFQGTFHPNNFIMLQYNANHLWSLLNLYLLCL